MRSFCRLDDRKVAVVIASQFEVNYAVGMCSRISAGNADALLNVHGSAEGGFCVQNPQSRETQPVSIQQAARAIQSTGLPHGSTVRMIVCHGAASQHELTGSSGYATQAVRDYIVVDPKDHVMESAVPDDPAWFRSPQWISATPQTPMP